MPPTIFVVRHAQGYHNIKRRHHLRDPHITGLGHEQCIQLRNSFPHHDEIDIIMASPLMRTIETASLVFEKALDRRNVPFMLVPMAQEIANQPCDIGFAPDELKTLVRETLAKENVSFDVAKIDFSLVEEGWNSKKGIYEASLLQVEKRAASLRAWLWRRPEKNIVLVSHGAFLHYFSEDWTFFDGAKGTAYENCEYRKFTFSKDSNEKEAHVEEDGGQRIKLGRPAGVHGHVLSGIEQVEQAGRAAL
ncbi:hypothetical protein MBLNU459_g4937t3 [Dothideomycetes sp. NU459]